MRQQAQRLMEVYEQNWPEKPLRDSSGKMLCLSPKHQGLTWPNLVSRVPQYMEATFCDVVSRNKYSKCVYTMFQNTLQQLRDGDSKGFVRMLREIPAATLGSLAQDTDS